MSNKSPASVPQGRLPPPTHPQPENIYAAGNAYLGRIALALAVVRILNQMSSQYQTAIIVVTHDEKIIPTFKRIYHIRDGRTFEEEGEGRALE